MKGQRRIEGPIAKREGLLNIKAISWKVLQRQYGHKILGFPQSYEPASKFLEEGAFLEKKLLRKASFLRGAKGHIYRIQDERE